MGNKGTLKNGYRKSERREKKICLKFLVNPFQLQPLATALNNYSNGQLRTLER